MKKFGLGFLFLLGLLSCASLNEKKMDEAAQRGRYYEAAEGYRKLYGRARPKDKERRARLAFKGAVCYLDLRQVERSWSLLKSAERNGSPDSMLYGHLAEVALMRGDTANLAKYLTLYSGESPTDTGLLDYLKSSYNLIRRSQGLKGRYEVQRLDVANSTKCDFAASYTPTGYDLYFTSNRGFAPKKELSAITGLRDNDLWRLKRDNNGRWQSRPDTLQGGVVSSADEGAPAFSPDGLSLYFTRRDSLGLPGIYRALKDGESRWAEPERLRIWEDSSRMAAHPSISPSGKWLAFVSDGGYGETDIYIYSLEGKQPPRNLGNQINTPRREMYPQFAGDSLLYFSSDGHAGYGGLDIFKAQLLPSGRWVISNLGVPINSAQDDFGFAIAPQSTVQGQRRLLQQGVFSSSRKDPRGYPHLYTFELPDVSVSVYGYVMDREGYAIEGAHVSLVGNVTDGSMLREVVTDTSGGFRLDIRGAVDYVMLASHPDYLNQYVRFHADSTQNDERYHVDFFLADRRQPEPLRKIFYDFDSDRLRDESTPQLEELLNILRDNPKERIILSAHADRWGGDSYNRELSLRRARAVQRWLLEHGIAGDRVIARGYGKEQPTRVSSREAEAYPFLPKEQLLDEDFIRGLKEEEQEIADQLNRRTEFIVLRGEDQEIAE